MTKHRHPPSLSERVRAALTGEDPELIRRIQEVERLAHVAENGKWQRRLAMLSIYVMAGGIIGGIWFAGGEWRDVKTHIAYIPAIRAEQAAMREALTELQADHQRVVDLAASVAVELTPPRAPATPTRRIPSSMSFPRAEQFDATRPRE